MSYCKHCDREVEGQRKFSWLAALFWMIVPSILLPFSGVMCVFVYVLYWAFIKQKHCPICKMGV